MNGLRRRARMLSVVLALVGGSLALIASTQTWFDVVLHDAPDAPLDVLGADALPVLAPLGIAALALGGVAAIAGRVLSVIVGVLTLAIGALLAALSLPIALDHPVSALASTVTTATGVAGDHAIGDLVDSVSATPWPAFGVVAGIVLVLVGILVLATAHTWRQSGKRYRTEGGAARPADDVELDAIDAWDDLSHGDDPTR